MKKALITFYLDWTNNFLSTARMAEYYEISQDECRHLIELGSKYHHESVENKKLIRK